MALYSHQGDVHFCVRSTRPPVSLPEHIKYKLGQKCISSGGVKGRNALVSIQTCLLLHFERSLLRSVEAYYSQAKMTMPV